MGYSSFLSAHCLALLSALVFSALTQVSHAGTRAEPPLEAQESLAPVADTQCKLAPSVRTERLHYLDKLILDSEDRSHRLREESKVLEEAVRKMEVAYQVAQVCKVTSDAASFAAGYGTLKAAIVAKQYISVSGRIIPLVIGQAITLNGLTRNSKLVVGKLEVGFRNRLANTLNSPLSLDSSLDFLKSPKCPKNQCALYSSEIESLIGELEIWHSEALARHTDSSGWPVFEFFHHDFGRQLAEIDLPWLSGLTILLDARTAYLETLRLAMLQDQAACMQE